MCSSSYKSFNVLFLQILVVSVLILSFLSVYSMKGERNSLERQLPLEAIAISQNNERYHSSHSILTNIRFIVNRQQPKV